MKKLLSTLTLTLLVTMLLGATASAYAPPDLSDEYDSMICMENKDAEWNPIEDCTMGRLYYNSSGENFTFNFAATGLEKNVNYSLVYYADPWPGTNGVVLVNYPKSPVGRIAWFAGGVDGSVFLGHNLPVPEDENEGAKIWLIPTEFLTDGNFPMDTWDREAILFECELINYTYTPAPVKDKDGKIIVYTPPPDFSFGTLWGFPAQVYYNGSGFPYPVKAWGKYNGELYMFEFPAGTVVKGNKYLFLSSIGGDTLIFSSKVNTTFSEDVIVYKGVGRFYYDMFHRLVGGTWEAYGSFNEIVDGQAELK